MRAKAICAVCAEAPTVRSHIIPRALFHDGRRAGRTMVLGGVESGYRVTQSGKWSSRILCAGHERKLAPCDDYGVSFCRSFAASSAQAGPRLLSNPAPGLLVDFAVASVWRMAAAISEGSPDKSWGTTPTSSRAACSVPGTGAIRRSMSKLSVSKTDMAGRSSSACSPHLSVPTGSPGISSFRACASRSISTRPPALRVRSTNRLRSSFSRQPQGTWKMSRAFAPH